MRAAIYLRVSTDEQDNDNQAGALYKLASDRGFEIIECYKEESSAWRAGHQKELARLLREARKRKFDVVLVWALDRLSRQGALAILTIVQRLKLSGVKVLSYQESWTEAAGELAELLYAITGWVAKMESERRSARTKAGLEKCKALGKRLGRPAGAKDKRKRKKRIAAIHAQHFEPSAIY